MITTARMRQRLNYWALLGLGVCVLVVFPGSAAGAPEAQQPKLARDVKQGRPPARHRPRGAVRNRDDIKRRTVGAPGSSSRSVSSHDGPPDFRNRGTTGAGSSRGLRGRNTGAQNPRGTAGAGTSGEEAWSNVELPPELTAGIEFKKPKRGQRFTFNFQDAALIELIKTISNITGKSFILGGKVPNIKASIYAPTKITAQEAYRVFLSVLRVNGLTVVPSGRYLKILPVANPTSQNTPIFNRRRAPSSDQIVTRLHPLEHVSAEEILDVLGRFKSTEGDITVYAPTNTLIITDYGSAIRRLLKLIAILDKPGTGEQIWIEPINYADANEMADRIVEIFDVAATGKRRPGAAAKAGKAKGRRGAAAKGTASVVGQESSDTKITKILPDERTNSLIIVASENAYLRILELIKRLDIPIAGEGTLHVHRLQHADATELAKTLNTLSRGARRGGGTGKKKGKGATGGDLSGLFEGELQISADKATNSLVVVSSLRDYIRLKGVIEQLDMIQRQVFVEAVIMEVSLDKNRELGLGFHAGNMVDMGLGDDQSLIYGTSQPTDKLNSLLLSAGTMSGLAAGIRGPEIEGTEDLLGVGISIPAFGVVLQALQTNSDVNVLSMPHILATDNEEASISVGENVPIQQGYNPAGAMLANAARQAGGGNNTGNLAGLMGGFGGFGGFGGMGMNIGRQNVGLELKITPHINDDDQVRLEINLKVEEIKTADSSLNPNISRQHANTTSVVADQQTIVIGGLITDNEVITTQKVPVLGDIPIIGMLFKHKSKLQKKRNLVIFLTPYIIRSADDFREIYTRKMNEQREFIERYTAFEYHRVDPHLDWTRTNGGLAEINNIIRRAEEDEILRAKSELETTVEHTPKEPIRFNQKKAAPVETPAGSGQPAETDSVQTMEFQLQEGD